MYENLVVVMSKGADRISTNCGLRKNGVGVS